MTTLPTRGPSPLRVLVDEPPAKKIRLHPGIDVRRWKALKAYWDLQKSLGKDLSLLRVGRKKGLKNANMATQILYGFARLNEIWMLCFAWELEATPQKIWGDDWPFADLTPDITSPGFERLMRQWQKLSQPARRRILGIINADQRR